MRFKSYPENYAVEKSGEKPYTIRIIDSEDPRGFECHRLISEGITDDDFIEIENTESHEFFKRQIKNVIVWKMQYIIAWRN